MQHIFSCLQNNSAHEYDNAMTWKHILHYWPFVWGIQQSPNSQRGSDAGLIFSVFLAWICSLTNIPVACDLRCHGTHVVSLYYFCRPRSSVIWYMQFSDMIHAIQPLIALLCQESTYLIFVWYCAVVVLVIFYLIASLGPANAACQTEFHGQKVICWCEF